MEYASRSKLVTDPMMSKSYSLPMNLSQVTMSTATFLTDPDFKSVLEIKTDPLMTLNS